MIGVNDEWVRSGSHVFSNSLFVGETENHGTPSAPGARKTSCSAVFPDVERTVTSLGGLPRSLFRLPDNVFAIRNSIMADARLRCDEKNGRFSFGEYQGYQLGVFQHASKGSLVPVRDLGNIFKNNLFCLLFKFDFDCRN